MSDSFVSGGSKDAILKEQLSRLDEEFIKMMLDVETHYVDFSKHDKIKIEQWTKALCQVTTNVVWKQNRNLYAKLLLHAILREELFEPFNKMPPEELPSLNRQITFQKLGDLEKELMTRRHLKRKKSQSPKDKTRSSSAKREIQACQVLKDKKRVVTEVFPEGSSDLKARKGWASKENTYQVKKLLPQKVQEELLRSSTPERTIEKSFQNLLRNEENNFKRQEVEKSTPIVGERKEMLKLKAEVELSKLNEDSLKNELDMKLVTISQVTRNLEKLNNDFQKSQDENIALRAFLKLAKRRVDDGTIQFSDNRGGEAFLREMNRTIAIFNLTPVGSIPRIAGPKSPENFGGEYYSKANLADPYTEPITDLKSGRSNVKGGVLTETNNFRAGNSIDQISGIKPQHSVASPNYYQLGSDSKTFLGDQTGQDLDPNYGYDKRTTMRSELRGSPDQFNRTAESKASRYDEMKAKLRSNNDKETTNFLDYLEKFQKDSDKLKKETEELLDRSSRLYRQNPKVI